MKPLQDRRFGIVSAEDRRSLSGLEFVEGLVSGALPLNSMARALGYDLTEVSRGRVVVIARPGAELLNPEGTVHGGLAATLLDTCMTLAITTMISRGVGCTTLEFKVSLLRPIMPDMQLIKAEGTVLRCGRRIGTADGRLIDRKGKLLAHATTTCLIFHR